MATFIPQLGTCSIENVWRATVQYGAVLNCLYCTVPEGMNFTCKHVFGVDIPALDYYSNNTLY